MNLRVQLKDLEKPLREALERLVKTDEKVRAAVVVETVTAQGYDGPFVQFAGSSTKPLVCDCPDATMGGNTAIDRAQAAALLGPSKQPFPDGDLRTHTKECSGVDEAVKLGVEVLCLVHRVPLTATVEIEELRTS